MVKHIAGGAACLFWYIFSQWVVGSAAPNLGRLDQGVAVPDPSLIPVVRVKADHLRPNLIP